MKAKSRSKSRAFAAKSGTCRSITPLPPPVAFFVPWGRVVHPPNEAGGDPAEGQLVAALDALSVYGSAVEEGAVGRAEVLDDEAILQALEPGVLSRDVRIPDDNGVLLGATDAPRPRTLQGIRLVVQHQLYGLPRQAALPGLLGRDGGRPLIPALLVTSLLGAEDAGLARGVLRRALRPGA